MCCLDSGLRLILRDMQIAAVIAGGPQPQQKCVVLAQFRRPAICLDEIAMNGRFQGRVPRERLFF